MDPRKAAQKASLGLSVLSALALASVFVLAYCDTQQLARTLERRPASHLEAEPSDFESMLQAIGGEIPNDPRVLVEKLDQIPDSQIVAAIVPYGRSPERFHTSIRSPRSLFVWVDRRNSSSYPAGKARHVFFGYTPRLNQLEIVSSDRRSGLSEFRIVRGLAPGMRPNVIQKNDECVSCHQNGAALFPVFPWSETNFNPMIPKKFQEYERDGTLDPFALYLRRNASKPMDFAIDVGQFDGTVLHYNMGLSTIQDCAFACGADQECRQSLMGMAVLRATEKDPSTAAALEAKVMSLMARHKDSSPIHYGPDGALNDRNPIESGAKLNEDGLPFDPRTLPGPKNDPIANRDSTGNARTTKALRVNECFNFSHDELATLRAIDTASLNRALRSEALKPLVQDEHWMPSTPAITKSVLALTQGGDAETVRALISRPAASSPNSDVRPELRRAPGVTRTPEQLFHNYCYRCHNTSEDSPGPDLPLSDPKALNKVPLDADRTVADLLEKHAMPPERGSRNTPLPTEEERAEMIKAVR